jgi:hypothetical protein
MRLTQKIFLFVSLVFISICSFGQAPLMVYSKNGNSLYMNHYGISNCPELEPVILYLDYNFPAGMSENNNWLSWKQQYYSCDGEILIQEFHAPICGVWKQSFDKFASAYINSSSPFSARFESVFPESIPNFKEFKGAPYDVSEVFQNNDFLPLSKPPVSACGSASFNLSIANFNSISINWNSNSDWIKSMVKYREKGTYNWNQFEIPYLDQLSNTYTIPNLNLDTYYEVQVGVKCSYSKDFIYSPSQYIVTDKSKCPIPDNIRIVHAFADSLTLNWSGDSLGKYLVNYKERNSTKWESMLVYSNQTSFSGLKFDTYYEFKIAGFDEFGQGTFSPIVSGISSANPAPSVYNGKINLSKTNSVVASWETLTPLSSGIYKNDISYDCILSAKNNPNQVQIKRSKITEVQFDNLEYETEYQIEIQATLLNKYKSEQKEVLEFKTKKLTRVIAFKSQNIHRDSLNVILCEKNDQGELVEISDFQFQNDETILTTLEFNKDYKQRPYTVEVAYKGRVFSECSQPILPTNADTIYINIATPAQLLNIFEKSTRTITEYRNKPSTIHIAGGYKSFFTQNINNTIIQPDISINLDFPKFSISGKTNFNKNQTVSDIQLFNNYRIISVGYNLTKGEIETKQLADKRFSIFSFFTYNSLKKIAPKYNVVTQINAGHLTTESNYTFNLYNIANSRQNTICSNQKINSFQTGLKIIFTSNYSLTYFQKGIGSKIKNPELGKETKRYSQLQIGLDFYSPINGSLTTFDTNNTPSQIEIPKSDFTAGFKFSIEHTYNIRNSNFTLTQGLDLYKANRISNGFESTQNLNLPVFCLSVKLGWANIR